MSTFKKEYEVIKSKREDLTASIHSLESNEIIKKYLELLKQDKQLLEQEKIIYKKMKLEEYSSCNHIWVNVCHEYDSWESRSEDFYGCMKCGLDHRVLKGEYRFSDFLTFDQKIMLEYMQDDGIYLTGINTKLRCDLNLAKQIYSKIKETYPNIDDETATQYFKTELENIRANKDIEKKSSKTLSLKPNFNK